MLKILNYFLTKSIFFFEVEFCVLLISRNKIVIYSKNKKAKGNKTGTSYIQIKSHCKEKSK